jgi:superfamily I DNA and RNA helicase
LKIFLSLQQIARDRKAKEQEIKTLQVRVNSIRADKVRLEENLTLYKEHKDFLDRLAPKVILFF